MKHLFLFLWLILVGFSPVKGQNIPFSLPDGFPGVEVSGHTANLQGSYFLNTFGVHPSHDSSWLMILDTTGFPLFYRMFHTLSSNFTVQENTGTLTYYSLSDTAYHEMDGNFNLINIYKAKNGFITDGHELRIQPDSSYWILGKDIRVIDMSVLIEGGNPAANVTGTVIQHISKAGNVLFEWNSWDHFDILDADTTIIHIKSSNFDFSHGNALDIVDDSTILLSSRSLNEITKINTNNGNIIWRWGGKHNQFTCLNDSVPFYAQHHIRYRGNGVYSLFDNGNMVLRPYSRALVYSLNEDDKTTEVISDFNLNHEDFSRVMGCNQLLPNGNYQVGWSLNFEKNVLTEYDTGGNTVFSMTSVDTLGLVSYRALKYNWTSTAFDVDEDTLEFESSVELGDTAFGSVHVTNNMQETLLLNGFYCTDSAFRVATPLPITLNPGETVSVDVLFAPDSSMYYNSVLSLLSSNDTNLIGQQIRVTGTGEPMGVRNFNVAENKLVVYPNPASNKVYVRFDNKNEVVKSVAVFDLSGHQLILKREINTTKAGLLDVSALPGGTYLIKVMSSGGIRAGKMVIL